MIFVFATLATLAAAARNAATATGIDTVVAIMYENRAFDHLLGHLKKDNPNINGLTGKETNPIDPSDPTKGFQQVSFDAADQCHCNPGHSVDQTFIELFGQSQTKINPAPMNGFISELIGNGIDLSRARHVMRCFNKSSVPTLSWLARNYAVSDEWFASVPGPTYVNRLFAMSGTSNGDAANEIPKFLEGYPQTSIFGQLAASDIAYRVYYHDIPSPLMMTDVRIAALEHHNLRPFDEFYADANAGTLPSFSWLDPRYFSYGDYLEQDQHPFTPSFFSNDSVLRGDDLLRRVYNALRLSPKWNSTLLVVYYDEHGGLYDHVSPPMTNVPNPDGKVSTNPPFAFDRLGVRVPAVFVSPRLSLGSIIRKQPGSGYLEHTSLLATLRELLPQLPRTPLTKREAWASTFTAALTNAPCGHNCPPPLPLKNDARSDDGSLAAYERAERDNPAAAALWHNTPMTELQTEFVELIRSLDPDDNDERAFADAMRSTAAGAHYARRRLNRFLGRAD